MHCRGSSLMHLTLQLKKISLVTAEQEDIGFCLEVFPSLTASTVSGNGEHNLCCAHRKRHECEAMGDATLQTLRNRAPTALICITGK